MKKALRIIDFIGAFAGFPIAYYYLEGNWQIAGYVFSVIGLCIALLNPAKYAEKIVKSKFKRNNIENPSDDTELSNATSEVTTPFIPDSVSTNPAPDIKPKSRPSALNDFSSYIPGNSSSKHFY